MADDSVIYWRMREAIGAGEVVGIIYQGGSQPGTYREIIPQSLDRTKVWAFCRMSNEMRFFALLKIALPDPLHLPAGVGVWDSQRIPEPEAIPTVREIEAAYRARFEAIGWHVVCVTDEDGERLCLHRWTKNHSRPLKGPTVVLSFTPRVYDLVVTPEGGFTRSNPRESARPWALRRHGSATATWKVARKAVEALLREAATYP